jgi:hypothetical protein
VVLGKACDDLILSHTAGESRPLIFSIPSIHTNIALFSAVNEDRE